MKTPSSSLFAHLIKATNLWALAAGIIFYAFGAGFVHYLGQPINWINYWLGQGCVTLLQLTSFYLKGFFDDPAPADKISRTQKMLFLQASVTSMAVGAAFTALLYARGVITLSILVILGAAFLLSFFYAVPPIKLVYRGYGELSTTFFLANLVPALSLIIQYGELHRILGILTFPLTALFLAMLLALSLPGYSKDIINNRKTLMIMLGWQRGMFMHNVLILLAYALLGASMLLNVPVVVVGPGLLTLPIGLYQISLMIRIANGSKPHWKLLTFSAVSCWSVTIYLLAFALWTR